MEISDSDLASRGKRLVAFLIDNFPITFLIALVYFRFFGFEEVYMTYLEDPTDEESKSAFIRLRNQVRDISFFLYLSYCILMEGSELQATLGKRIMKIKVVHHSGQPLSLIQAVNRNISKILSSIVYSIGFIWILFDKKHQGWHDKIAKTYVVNETYENLPEMVSKPETEVTAPSQFHSISDGNQNNLLYEADVQHEWIEEMQHKYRWDDFELYDNRLTSYTTKLFDDVVRELNYADDGLLWNNLTRGQKTLWTFTLFHADTNNGGVYQFLMNWPEFIFAAQEMLREIGAIELAEDYDAVVNQLTQEIDNIAEFKQKFNDKSLGWEARWEAFTSGYDHLDSTKKIETYFYEDEFKKELYQKVCKYIESNIDQFI
ncbi:MAG: RDD family protein [Bacteroidia bacterium]|nr:RDD family protein [Bacteroidia bacterium]